MGKFGLHVKGTKHFSLSLSVCMCMCLCPCPFALSVRSGLVCLSVLLIMSGLAWSGSYVCQAVCSVSPVCLCLPASLSVCLSVWPCVSVVCSVMLTKARFAEERDVR